MQVWRQLVNQQEERDTGQEAYGGRQQYSDDYGIHNINLSSRKNAHFLSDRSPYKWLFAGKLSLYG